MPFKRSPKTPFALTDKEKEILGLLDGHLSSKEIAAQLGCSLDNVLKLETTAIYKQRLILLDKRKAESFTSQSKAHGRIRMQGTK